MTNVWNRENFESSITRTCFSSTPYDTGWDGAARWDIDGAVLQGDAEIARLLELEFAVRPVPVWAQKIARQVEQFPPCGWSFPQCVESICINIGAGDAEAKTPPHCYVVGRPRLQLMADYAVCLDGWLKQVPPQSVAAHLLQDAPDARDWQGIVTEMWEGLGDATPPKTLLVRRLLGRLRFWLRAPYGFLEPDDNARLGYLYTQAMSKYGGWDYFGFEDHDPDVVELQQRIREEVANPDKWLDMINCTWPCAPKVFRYLERLVVAIGRVGTGEEATPPKAADAMPGKILQIEGTFLDSKNSHGLFDAATQTLGNFLGDDFPTPPPGEGAVDAAFRTRLAEALGEASPETLWLAALLLKRILLFKDSFKSFHFTRNAQQVA